MTSLGKELIVLILAIGPVGRGQGPLFDYVKRPEPSYGYYLHRMLSGPGYKAYVLNMSSVSWLDHGLVDRTNWRHWLTIVVPDLVWSNKALLWIDGGTNDDPAPSVVEPAEALFALVTGTVVAHLRMVPNQPLVFSDEQTPRYEDAIIAYTFDKYLSSLDPNWPALFPMAKSAVLAMDTVQSFLLARRGLDVEGFVVCGASKRGWTTWLTAAVDNRVVAIAPLVIDILNMERQMRHHYGAYGRYSEAIADYERMGIFDRLDTVAGRQLAGLVDPYTYRQAYSMPKILINSCGDQFFLPDAAEFYVKDLPGQTYIRYCPNADHGLQGSDAMDALLSFYRTIVAGQMFPSFDWSIDANDQMIVRAVTPPARVRLWQATNPNARDFRLQTIGRAWTSSILTPQASNTYIARVPRPVAGWTAYFVELEYDGFANPIRLTTPVHVVPSCLPFAYKLGLDEDWDVDLADIAILANQWLTAGPGADIAPTCGDGWVDLQDYALLASQVQEGGR